MIKIMPMRQMKETSEHHQFVIKPQLQNNPKTCQNGKGPPPIQESQNAAVKTQNHQYSPPSRNRGRRRGRNGRKSDQGDACMPPSSRPCTAADKTVPNYPSSSKSLSFASRPGFGQLGTKCVVKANHFFAELPNKDLNQYDVSELLVLYSLGS